MHFFDYEFLLPDSSSTFGERDPAIGTYFYHSHVGMQAMSAFGALIIHPKKKEVKTAPVKWDDELIMMLSDGYHVGIVVALISTWCRD
jgi:FtsP/CotA-like multicopper oxidase with cupredoxin domain